MARRQGMAFSQLLEPPPSPLSKSTAPSLPMPRGGGASGARHRVAAARERTCRCCWARRAAVVVVRREGGLWSFVGEGLRGFFCAQRQRNAARAADAAQRERVTKKTPLLKVARNYEPYHYKHYLQNRSLRLLAVLRALWMVGCRGGSAAARSQSCVVLI